MDGPGIGSARPKWTMILDLAEVLAAEQLLEADDLGAAAGGLTHARKRLAHVLLGVERAAHLHQTEGDAVRVAALRHGTKNTLRK